MVMTKSLLVYDPTAPATARSADSRRRLDRLAGTVVGFIDNAKPNFSFLVDDLAALLTERYGVMTIVKRSKRGPSMPAAEDVIEELTSQCDFVITGSGD
jgi:hypothetical protein